MEGLSALWPVERLRDIGVISPFRAQCDAIRAALNNFNGSASGATIRSVHLADEADGDPEYLDGRDKPTYVVQHTYQIRWEE